MSPKIRSKETDVLVDTILYSCLFYVLSHPSMYASVTVGQNLMTDRQAVHAMLFAVSYLAIQKLTKRI
jgi:hypothetical protein